MKIYDLETNYLEETKEFGNIFTGWSNYLSSDKTKNRKIILLEDRLFSLSSVTSPVSKNEERKRVNYFKHIYFFRHLTFLVRRQQNYQLILQKDK